jgi:hypothetical protein
MYAICAPKDGGKPKFKLTYKKFSGPPFLRGGVVLHLRLDPVARATAQMPLLPERRLGFKIIHEKGRRRESLAAMQARGDDENDSLARPDQTIAVHGEDSFERPAGSRLKGGAVDFGLRHSRIMFDFERREGAALVAAKPGKTYQRADIGASLRQPGGFGRNIKTFLLNAHNNPGTHALTPRSSVEKRQSPARSESRRRA